MPKPTHGGWVSAGTDFYAALVRRVGEREAQVMCLAYHLHTLKPWEPDDVCIAFARWMLPHFISRTDRGAEERG